MHWKKSTRLKIPFCKNLRLSITESYTIVLSYYRATMMNSNKMFIEISICKLEAAGFIMSSVHFLRPQILISVPIIISSASLTPSVCRLSTFPLSLCLWTFLMRCQPVSQISVVCLCIYMVLFLPFYFWQPPPCLHMQMCIW